MARLAPPRHAGLFMPFKPIPNWSRVIGLERACREFIGLRPGRRSAKHAINQWMRFVDAVGKLASYHMHPTGIPTVLSTLLTKKQRAFEPHFNHDLLQRSSTIFQFRFSSGEDFFLSVSQDTFRFNEGNAINPTLTLYLDHHETCWQLLMGRRDGMDAFMNGKYRADGNIVLSQLLLYLFKTSDPAVAFNLQG